MKKHTIPVSIELRSQVETYQTAMHRRDALTKQLNAADESAVDTLVEQLTEAQDHAERYAHAIASGVAVRLLGSLWRDK